MNCPEAACFLSCSFRDEDRELNDFVVSICKGINIKCTNVESGYSRNPPEVAKDLIKKAKIFIAIVPKRTKVEDGSWKMPSAVHDEISMAYALSKPMLMLIEKDVLKDGFLQNYGTHLSFDRTEICNTENIRKFITSIHDIKMEAVDSHDIVPQQDISGFYSEKLSLLIELLNIDNELTWQYSQSRRIKFTKNTINPVRTSSWAAYAPKDTEEKIQWDFHIEGGSKNFKALIETERDTPQQIDLITTFEPTPEEGDYIDISWTYRSKYLNARTLTDIPEGETCMLGSKSFHCNDGLIPIQRTKELNLQFRFPKDYQIIPETIFPFVGSYTARVDYLVESEMKRLNSKITTFAGTTVVDCQIESPLLGHVYGIGWDLRG